MKDVCDADYFNNLSMFEEDCSDRESTSFDEDSSAESRSESESDDSSNESKIKRSIKESCRCVPKKLSSLYYCDFIDSDKSWVLPKTSPAGGSHLMCGISR